MKLLRAYLCGLLILAIPSFLIHLHQSGRIFRQFAFVKSDATHLGHITTPDQILSPSKSLIISTPPAISIPAAISFPAAISTQTAILTPTGKKATQFLRVPSVDELCTNPAINDELSGIYSTFQWKSSKHLPRMLTEDQTLMMHEFLHSVMKAFCDLKIEWMIYYGSLLGAYISHDALPWDDDLDIILEEKALNLLASHDQNGTLSARYNISYVVTSGLHKLYWSSGKTIEPYSWAWPFMDIIAYDMTSKTDFSNIDRTKGHRFKAQVDWVYPLHMRPFGPVVSQLSLHVKGLQFGEDVYHFIREKKFTL
ncbi:hypothetical protein CAPTEDRAFT_207152 [Capitella teleta]|uniref:LicD/FKTN/FKRP nucleotidyltransferase domain-containing protein n=1 Tax=Capitella teleta TaxID=283909 RepID=R7T741_CAPTE|nr:hypothetical protein CAPTEDRAFT_207152 [Capitella teleta]|eukprot:ELT87180.1 hypothetical protein CAPTEDRAFT_207152 [Capitella teleta]